MNLPLEQIASLQDNWNGEGASKFSQKLITIAEKILHEVPYKPDIFPIACNAIQFEYEKNNGEYLEFEIYENSVHMYSINIHKEHSSVNLKYPKDIDKIKKYINTFYK